MTGNTRYVIVDGLDLYQKSAQDAIESLPSFEELILKAVECEPINPIVEMTTGTAKTTKHIGSQAKQARKSQIRYKGK